MGTRIGEFFASLTPRTLAWSAAVAALAIVLQAGYIANSVIKENAGGGYETASVPGSVKGPGAYALIRFQPQANASDIANFLETNTFSVVGGPSAGGLYTVRIAPAALPKDALAGLIKKLQGDRVVGFIAATE